jgi:hypothetical protein
MAFAFLTLGATVMHGSGHAFSPRGGAFAVQLVQLYTSTLGSWTGPIVITAVLTTMLSTAVTVIDGFPRAIDRSLRVVTAGRIGNPSGNDMGPVYWVGLVSLAVGTIVFIVTLVSPL